MKFADAPAGVPGLAAAMPQLRGGWRGRGVREFASASLPPPHDAGWRQVLFRLLLGLEFALVADSVRSARAPGWDDIGQLAAIAASRTFLDYFLERDLGEAGAG